MKIILLFFVLLLVPGLSIAQTLPPTTINYQGRVSVAGAPVEGTGYFKFLLCAPDKRLWSNDDSHTGSESLAAYEPSGNVSVGVTAGLFFADLGSGTMPAITSSVLFDGSSNVRSEVYLRVWFSTSSTGPFVKLAPDRRLSSVPFALVAGTVTKGAITTDKLATESVAGGNIQSDAVTARNIRNGEVIAEKMAAGVVDSLIGDDAITSGRIKDGEVKTVDLAGEIVSGVEVVPGAVTGAKIADGSISSADVGYKSLAPDRISADIAVLWDQKGSTEAGGTSGNTAWNLRVLNRIQRSLETQTSSIRLVSDTDGTFALKKGQYMIDASAPAWASGMHQLSLRRVSDLPATTIAFGTVESSTNAQTRSFIKCIVDVTDAESIFQFWHFTASANGTNGLGLAAPGGVSAPIYSTVTITRIE